MNSTIEEKINQSLELAKELVSHALLKEASEIYKVVLTFKQDASLFLAYGNVLNTMRKFEDACEAYQKAVKLNPDLTDAYTQMGIIFSNQKKYNDAESCFKAMVRINPSDCNGYAGLGFVYRMQNQFEKSLENSCLALKINPYDERPLLCLALLSLHFFKHNLFIDSLNTVLNASSTDIEVWRNSFKERTGTVDFLVGFSFELEGKLKEAIAFYEQSYKKCQGAGWSFTRRTVALLKYHHSSIIKDFDFFQDEPILNDKFSGVVAMPNVATEGRFGDELQKYITAKLYAKRHNLKLETPEWVGRYLFKGCYDDYPVSTYPNLLNVENIAKIQRNSLDSPERQWIYDTFEPLPCWKPILDSITAYLLSKGNTLISVHLRRGDFVSEKFWIPSNQLYLDLLEKLWNQVDKPLLYIASDDIASVKKDFIKYNPITAGEIGVFIKGLEFFTDYYVLMTSDIVLTSQSSFSQMACLLNKKGKLFFCPDKNTNCLEIFNPWM